MTCQIGEIQYLNILSGITGLHRKRYSLMQLFATSNVECYKSTSLSSRGGTKSAYVHEMSSSMCVPRDDYYKDIYMYIYISTNIQAH